MFLIVLVKDQNQFILKNFRFQILILLIDNHIQPNFEWFLLQNCLVDQLEHTKFVDPISQNQQI